MLEWLPREKLLQIPHWEGDAIFLDLLQQEAPFFSLKVCYEGTDWPERSSTGGPSDQYAPLSLRRGAKQP